MPSTTTTELRVSGMTCNNCARKVTEAAQKIPGVHSVSVSVAAEHASVRWNSAAAKNVPAILAAISEAGFHGRRNFPAESCRRIQAKSLAMDIRRRPRGHRHVDGW